MKYQSQRVAYWYFLAAMALFDWCRAAIHLTQASPETSAREILT